MHLKFHALLENLISELLTYTDKFSLIFKAITLARAKCSRKKNFKTVYDYRRLQLGPSYIRVNSAREAKFHTKYMTVMVIFQLTLSLHCQNSAVDLCTFFVQKR